jgi:glycosyltransferase involved in cell wall biosynthesis
LLFNRFDRWVLDVQFAGLRRMDHFLAHSERTREGLVSSLGIPRNRISIVPSSVDSEHFRPIDGAKEIVASRYGIGFDAEAADLLFVGSELPRKNLITLLEAMALLKTRGLRPRLLKVGGAGGERWRARFLRDIADLGLESDVVITDVVPEADLPLLYNAADLCVTPTLLEGGFAWLAMEAMACARPVVASLTALVPEAARSVVPVVPPRDHEALANAIQHCLVDETLRQQMGTRGRQIIETYCWESEAKAVVQVYDKVASVAGR